MKKKVLVTGSAGFIFGNFIRKALFMKSNYDFASVDRCDGPNALHSIYSNKGHQFYPMDITSKHFMNMVFSVERPDIVIHGAAETFVDDAIADASNFINSNVLGTQNIVDACVKWGVERLIYISTDEVYGQLKNEDDKPWVEEAPLAPRNPYSASKAAGELLVRAAYETHGLKYNITRSCNNYGPRQHRRNYIPKIIRNILNGDEIPVYGKGMQLREWIHVDDNCSAIMKVMESGLENETYNISTGHEFTNLEVFHEICNIANRGHHLLKFVDDRPGHDFRYAVDSTKLRFLGWKPNYKFKNGLYQTFSWYEKNANWSLGINTQGKQQ